ncbi:uncharacterized protein BCR38DRAFT_433677 [Pseudomassariella vexata]|uniref:Secreted protein n=1 Tax=Pseudomassariella vexata TaxID=1141098 RepID=A0A1Y2DZF3_9PEZI|nr:uncharacterized protein BCR38DRAFT_433677 [Pseudomassariella vexata]ORY64005.1 hypothetical protein BCR38DRAFT_433677 [Pseudomassariella vexata]
MLGIIACYFCMSRHLFFPLCAASCVIRKSPLYCYIQVSNIACRRTESCPASGRFAETSQRMAVMLELVTILSHQSGTSLFQSCDRGIASLPQQTRTKLCLRLEITRLWHGTVF